MQTVRKLEIVKGYNSQAVEHLQELLDRAIAGEVLEVVCCAKLVSGQHENSYTGCSDLHELVGQLERMKFLTLRRMDG